MPKSSRPKTKTDGRNAAPRGRLLDELMQQKVCAVISLGCSGRTAADYLGCRPETIRRTARRLPQFAEQMAKAAAMCEVSALTQLGKAIKDERNWRAVLWLLERRFPEHYARRRPHSVTPRQVLEVTNQLIEIVAAEITDVDDRQRIVERLQAVVARLREYDEASETP